ncbi:uncharacterized protein [Garra rufa]|uniref:uncharacterized protein n=1 Tax=Garra rufa TaxID=137080 RepID=UPI003CCEB960
MRTTTSISFSALWLMENSLAVNITGSVGSNISVTCSYPETYQNNSKYFCQMSGSFAQGDLQCVHITQQKTRSEQGRLALLDDTSAHVLMANISGLAPEDSGKYWCGVDIAQLPDFTTEIWITVAKGLVRHCTRTISNPVADGHQRINLPDLPKVQSEKEELHRTANTEPVDRDSYYIDVISAQTKDQIYTQLDSNRQRCLLDTIYSKIGYEGKYITFKAFYPPDYETNTKYFGRTDRRFFFEKLVQTSHPNQWVKQGRFALFDNTSTHVLTAVISGLVAEDSGNYSFGVDIKLLPDLTGDEIQLTVITGEVQRPTAPTPTPTPTPKVIVYSTSRPANITAQNWAKTRDQESYIRFVTVLCLVCVCTLLVVCPFVLFKVIKWTSASKPSVSVSYHTRKTSAQIVDEYVKMTSVVLKNSPTADKASVVDDFHRPANIDACYTDHLAQPDLDQIYTEMSPGFVQEPVYQSINH